MKIFPSNAANFYQYKQPFHSNLQVLINMKNQFLTSLASSFLAVTGIAIASSVMPAQAFVITSQLTGDIRPENPDNLFVDVKITSGEGSYTANQAFWQVDINSLSHPNIKLDEFYFNLADSIKSKVQLSGFDPNNWTFNSPASVQGAGGVTPAFQFEILKDKNSATNVTNATNLSFLMTLTGGGSFSASDFLNAIVSKSNDAGAGQLGAHLQSLSATGGQSDSGFAFGNYSSGSNGGGIKVPEPASLAGIGLVAGAMAVSRRRKVSPTT